VFWVNGNKAEMGIGTLIIFIAMILVAAIAAGVLIQTATSLQNKALLTGERSKTQVSTNVMPIIIYAEDGSVNHDVQSFYAKVKLAPGSDPITLSELLVEISSPTESTELSYNDTMGCTAPNSTHFGVEYLIQGNSYSPGYLQRGDVVQICFNATSPIEEDVDVTILLVPKVGSPTIIETALPDIITEQRVVIYP
jgi:flagellin FlaB